MLLNQKKAQRFGYVVATAPALAFVAIYYWYGFVVSPYIDPTSLANLDPPW